jgi:hypothetical protein
MAARGSSMARSGSREDWATDKMRKALFALILLTGTAIADPLLAQDPGLMDGGEIDFGDLVSLLPAFLALILYFVPTIISHMRDVQNYAKIFFVNLILGWTVVGWIAVLIWSIRAKPFFGR